MAVHYTDLNNWDVTPEEAVAIQESLRASVVTTDDFSAIQTVAGIDVGVSADGMATGGIIVLSFPELTPIETATAAVPIKFPYVPGLLSFREAPAILAAFDLLIEEPDLLIFDGQGIAHPRRLGIASHIGIILNKPSIGCAKTRLIGDYIAPGPQSGDSSPLAVGEEQIGTVLRTKERTNPLFISPGHRVGFDSAARFILECTKGYRLPEPTRLAHNLVSQHSS